MKTIFDAATQDEILSRINKLTVNHEPLWGKMNAYQMAKHCTLCDDMMLGNIKIKRVFIGRLIGRMILKKALQADKPFGKNSPTAPILITTADYGDLEEQKKEWIQHIKQYNHFDNPTFVHPFFGKMSKDEIGVFTYKHTDHHLRQFGL
jgi:hypothetical protein